MSNSSGPFMAGLKGTGGAIAAVTVVGLAGLSGFLVLVIMGSDLVKKKR